MKFTILKENLSKVLTIASRNISFKPQLPILSNIFLKAENNQLKIAVSNLEMGLQFLVPAKVEKEGEITVPGKLLTEFVSALSAEKINFALQETNLSVTTEKTKATFSTITATDFPTFPGVSKNIQQFPFKNLKEVIGRVAFAASNDEGRPVLTGIKTSIKEGVMTLTATDGYRLSMEQLAIPDKRSELQIILPAQTLVEVMRIAQEMATETISFSTIESKNQAVFSFATVAIFTRLIDGEFPTVEKIIPSEFKTKVVLEKERFIQAVKIASLFARGSANIIKLIIGKNGVRLSANTPQLGEDEDFVEAKIEGEETTVAFNYRFLLDLLLNFPEEAVVFETLGPLNPGVFKPTSALPYLHLIMPVRVQS